MNATELFLKLVKDFAKDGKITDVEKILLQKKAVELGIDDESLETFIAMELANTTENIQVKTETTEVTNVIPKFDFENAKNIEDACMPPVNTSNSSGGNKLMLLEMFIKEMARDGIIDEKEKETILKKGKELNIAAELVIDLIQKEVNQNRKQMKTFKKKVWMPNAWEEGFNRGFSFSFEENYPEHDKTAIIFNLDKIDEIIIFTGDELNAGTDDIGERENQKLLETKTKIEFIEFTKQGCTIKTTQVLYVLSYKSDLVDNDIEIEKQECVGECIAFCKEVLGEKFVKVIG